MTTLEIPFELESLTKASSYQKWMLHQVEPFLGRRILEVGSGIGNLSQWLPKRDVLLLSEPDPGLFGILKNKLPNHDCIQWSPFDSVTSLKALKLDTIVSFNVLEHIEEDIEAMKSLSSLIEGGCLITLVPAHSFAYGAMDRDFGHYRRYDLSHIKKIVDACNPISSQWFHFNPLGLLGWIISGRVFRQRRISSQKIEFVEKNLWVFKLFDQFFKRFSIPLGQSIVFVMRF